MTVYANKDKKSYTGNISYDKKATVSVTAGGYYYDEKGYLCNNQSNKTNHDSQTAEVTFGVPARCTGICSSSYKCHALGQVTIPKTGSQSVRGEKTVRFPAK